MIEIVVNVTIFFAIYFITTMFFEKNLIDLIDYIRDCIIVVLILSLGFTLFINLNIINSQPIPIKNKCAEYTVDKNSKIIISEDAEAFTPNAKYIKFIKATGVGNTEIGNINPENSNIIVDKNIDSPIIIINKTKDIPTNKFWKAIDKSLYIYCNRSVAVEIITPDKDLIVYE